MMVCPQCRQQVPAKLSWIFSGANGSSCPHCKASLCPRAACAVVLFLLACALGDTTLIVLRHFGVQSWLTLLAFFVAFAATYLAGLRLILRLRVKTVPPAKLDPSRI